MPSIGEPYGGQPYRGFTEPVYPSTATGKASLTSWRRGIDTALGNHAAPSHGTAIKLGYLNCATCLAIRSGRRERPWTDDYFRALAADGVPAETLLHAEMEMLHATHHDETVVRNGESVLMLGFRVILAHYLEADTVPRQEMVHALNEQSQRHLERIDAEKQAVREQIREEHGARMHELQVQLANVGALVSWAFHHGRRKTMRTDEVRAAIEWRTGEPIPEVTVAEHQRTQSAIAAGQPWRTTDAEQSHASG